MSVEYIGTVDQRCYMAGNGYETETIWLTNLCTNPTLIFTKQNGWPSRHSAGQKIKMNYIEYLTHIQTWDWGKVKKEENDAGGLGSNS